MIAFKKNSRSGRDQKNFRRPSEESDKPQTTWRKSAPPIVCEIAGLCRSCDRINDDYGVGLKRKWENDSREIKRVFPNAAIREAISSPRKLGYRHVFKLSVQPHPRGRGVNIGLYQPGTHRLVYGLDQCPIQATALNDLLRDLPDVLQLEEIKGYDEVAHTGDLRHIAARTSQRGTTLSLVFVVRDLETKDRLKNVVKRLVDLQHKINDAWIHVNTDKTNAIFSREPSERIYGRSYFTERLNDLEFEVPPGAFFQVNPFQAQAIYQRIAEVSRTVQTKDGKQPVAWDLYCGLGPISLHLAREGLKVFGVEENEPAIRHAERHAGLNNLNTSTKFLASPVHAMTIPDGFETPQIIVANPSRRGLEPAARDFLVHEIQRPTLQRFIYLSCDLTTLLRDLEVLKEKGLKVQFFEAYDMFAFTDKLEWLVHATC